MQYSQKICTTLSDYNLNTAKLWNNSDTDEFLDSTKGSLYEILQLLVGLALFLLQLNLGQTY